MKKTDKGVTVTLCEPAREALQAWIEASGKVGSDFLFTALDDPHGEALHHSTYRRIVKAWARLLHLDPSAFSTHSLRRTQATHLYRRTGNLRAVQLLLGHSNIAATQRYLGIEVDDAIQLAARNAL